MTGGRRRFPMGAPAWGENHLGLDAIVAFVDDELTPAARGRACEHLAGCPECAAEVVAQRQARTELRDAEVPSMPSSLLNSLRAIPNDADLPGPPPGLALSADGQFVSLLRPEPPQPPPPPPPPLSPRRSPLSRRARLGAGAAVSGIALGALALGAPAAPDVASPGAPFGGVVPNGPAAAVLDARMTLGPVATTSQPSAPQPITPASLEHSLAERLDRLPVVSPFRESR